MAGTFELDQAEGAQSQIIMAKESDWGVASLTANWKRLNVIPGEALDINVAVYESRVIRNDRMANKSVRGTQRPGGGLPQELGPRGQLQLLYSLLGNKVSTTPSGGAYVHVIKGAVSGSTLPMFTLEKGFLDLATPQYQAFLGCRVNAVTIDFNVDQIPLCNFDILARECVAFSPTSVVVGTPADQTYDPFTSVQVTLYEGASGSATALATCQSLQLVVNNNLYPNAFALGSNLRKHLKAGQRRTSFTGSFTFNDTTLYNKAINGTDTSLQIAVTDGTYSYDFLMANVDLYPNNSSPKISSDGPLTINLMGMAAKDTAQATDIKMTVTSPEATPDT